LKTVTNYQEQRQAKRSSCFLVTAPRFSLCSAGGRMGEKSTLCLSGTSAKGKPYF